jgi:hypothetical protein
VISQKLAATDPSNAGWQRDLAISEETIGDTLSAQGNLAGALKSYQADLAISQKLAAADPSNAEWQRDLFVAYAKLGTLDTPSNPKAERGRLLSSALLLVEKLQQDGHLTAQQKAWPAMIRQELQELASGQTP